MKIEPNGVGGRLPEGPRAGGRALEVSSPRGSFVLQPGEGPVVLLSAGIGATPVLAMLYAMASARSTRPVLWLHGARDGKHLPFAAEVRRLVQAWRTAAAMSVSASPRPPTGWATDFDAAGHLSRAVFDNVGLTRRLTSTYVGRPASWRT